MFANRYLVQVHIGANVVRLMEVLAAPKGVEAIIGRDLLNQFVITLHGPASTYRGRLLINAVSHF